MRLSLGIIDVNSVLESPGVFPVPLADFRDFPEGFGSVPGMFHGIQGVSWRLRGFQRCSAKF